MSGHTFRLNKEGVDALLKNEDFKKLLKQAAFNINEMRRNKIEAEIRRLRSELQKLEYHEDTEGR